MFFLATSDDDGQPTCSYKGGEPGFVHVVDERTVAFPNYDGNGMYLSMGNVLRNPRRRHAVHRLREGAPACASRVRRRIDFDDPLLADCPEAQFVVRVACASGVSELPALHPPLHARRAVAVRAAGRLPHAGAGLEADGLGVRRPARARPRPRPGRARRARRCVPRPWRKPRIRRTRMLACPTETHGVLRRVLAQRS